MIRYSVEHADCMICDYVEGTVIIRYSVEHADGLVCDYVEGPVIVNYKVDYADCIVCDYVGGPVIIRYLQYRVDYNADSIVCDNICGRTSHIRKFSIGFCYFQHEKWKYNHLKGMEGTVCIKSMEWKK